MSQLLSSHSSKQTLSEWLFYLENLHSTEIDLGLNRIAKVASRLNIDLSFAQVITVAGTNGKGTTCAFIENALLNASHSVAVYSSPHIELFNERLRINQVDITDQPLIDAFEKIEHSRDEISLTYYEYTTLAAFIVMMKVKPEYIILEVGLGGRLDATNIIDADIAVVTTVDIDHQDFLGDNRESIGFEKAGIFRSLKYSVIGDKAPPKSLKNFAQSIQTQAFYRDENFNVRESGDSWGWSYQNTVYNSLKYPNIPLDNVATAIMVLSLLKIPLCETKLNFIIEKTQVAGRTELFKLGYCDVVLDVGHNPQAARYLSSYLNKKNYNKVHAVIGMLKDKDITNVLAPLQAQIASWSIGNLTVPRAATAQDIASMLSEHTQKINCFDNVSEAFKIAKENADENDLILVFGSFYTVAEIRNIIINNSH